MSPPSPTLSRDDQAKLQFLLDELTTSIPGCQLTLSTSESVLFDGVSGKFDFLETGDDARMLKKDDILWFASTTKAMTSVCYLQLVDRGLLTLDTPMAQFSPDLETATSQVFSHYSPHPSSPSSPEPIFHPAKQPVTLRMMLNQTSGFGAEFGDKVKGWKQGGGPNLKGKGFVNSCKAENLIHTPLMAQPGEVFQYGNSAEWLALIMPNILSGQSYEDYLQENLCAPLGLTSTSFFPFDDSPLASRVTPIRILTPEGEWQVLTDQLDLLKLPRTKKEIEYPAGGGGIYSNTRDYCKFLQHLLKLHYSLELSESEWPEDAILSRNSASTLFSRSLPQSALESLATMMKTMARPSFPDTKDDVKPGEVDWSTAFSLYLPADGRPWGGYGRSSGSGGWAGAAGSWYWVDPKMGIACAFSTQMLPSSHPLCTEARIRVETLVYELLRSS